MKRRRHGSGVLTGLGKPDLGHKSRKVSKARKVMGWIGGGIFVVAALLMVWVVGQRMFNPTLGERQGEGIFEVIDIRESPKGYDPERGVVAAAIVRIEERAVRIPMTRESRVGVEKGTPLHVRYTAFPSMQAIRVEAWEIEKSSPPPTAP